MRRNHLFFISMIFMVSMVSNATFGATLYVPSEYDTIHSAIDDCWVGGDYHLKSQAGRWDSNSKSWVCDNVTSPCIDAGDPNSDIGWETAPHGRRINMGAYSGTLEASRSVAPVLSWEERYEALLDTRVPDNAPMAGSDPETQWQATDGTLMIFDPGMFDLPGSPCLVWHIKIEPVGGGCGEWILIDAHNGEVLLKTPTCIS